MAKTDRSTMLGGKGNDNSWLDPASEDRHRKPQAAGVSGSGTAVKAIMT